MRSKDDLDDHVEARMYIFPRTMITVVVVAKHFADSRCWTKSATCTVATDDVAGRVNLAILQRV